MLKETKVLFVQEVPKAYMPIKSKFVSAVPISNVTYGDLHTTFTSIVAIETDVLLLKRNETSERSITFQTDLEGAMHTRRQKDYLIYNIIR